MKERIRFTIYEWQQRGGTAHQLAADIMRVIDPALTALAKYDAAENERRVGLGHMFGREPKLVDSTKPEEKA